MPKKKPNPGQRTFEPLAFARKMPDGYYSGDKPPGRSRSGAGEDRGELRHAGLGDFSLHLPATVPGVFRNCLPRISAEVVARRGVGIRTTDASQPEESNRVRHSAANSNGNAKTEISHGWNTDQTRIEQNFPVYRPKTSVEIG
jgi:hypothetical protein